MCDRRIADLAREEERAADHEHLVALDARKRERLFDRRGRGDVGTEGPRLLGERLGRKRARVVRRQRDNFREVRRDLCEIAHAVLIGHDAHHGRDFPAAEMRREYLMQRRGTAGVVPAVEDDERLFAQPFHARRNIRRRKALLQRIVGNLHTPLAQDVDHGQRCRGIVHLVRAGERRRERQTVPREFRSRKRGAAHLHAALVGDMEFCTALGADCGNLLRDAFGVVRIQRHRAARLDDAGLFKRDLLERVAEHCRVVERNGGDRRRLRRVDHICRVHPAAETDLQYDKIAAAPREPVERQRRDELEFRDGLPCGLELFGGWQHALYSLDQLRLWDHFPIDAKPLAEIQYIRRGIKARAIARRVQNACNQRTCRTLAVRTRHVDKPRALFGIAERIAQRLNPLEARLHAEQQAVVDFLKRFLIRHRIPSL